MNRGSRLAGFLLSCLAAMYPSAAALAAPAVLTFDVTQYGGSSTSLALLPNGLPAVACDGSHLQYGWFDGGTWQFSVVVDGSYSGVSLAILPSGHPALSFAKFSTHELKYAQFDGAVWQITTIVSNAYNLGSRGLVIRPDGNPAIAFLDTSYQVVYAWYDGATWQQTVLGDGGYCTPSLLILPSGAPAMAYNGSGGLTYAWLEGGTWQTSAVGSAAIFDLSLALLPSGQPAIAYDGWDYWEGPYLRFAWFTGEQWYTEWVAPGGQACSLAVDGSGAPAVGHLDPDTYTMYYSWRTGDSWQTQILDTSCGAGPTGLVRLASGHLLFSYTVNDFSSPIRLAAICGPPVSLYANPTMGDDTWDGRAAQWDGTHGPKATIGAALGQAWNLDEVTLAPGIYTGAGNRDMSFYGRQITVRGEDPNDPAVVAATVIDCAASPGDRHRAFVFSGGEGPEAALRGVTIRNGCAPLTPQVDYPDWRSDPLGGAIFGRVTSPTIADCVFQNNEALYGGAINIDAPEGEASNPLITRCRFEGNRVVQVDNMFAPGGGAVICYRGAPTLTDCWFSENMAQNTGGEFICMGGALDLSDVTTTVARCTFLGNSADPRGVGGAVVVGSSYGTTDCVLADCVFAGNYAAGAADFHYWGGGAIYADECSLVLSSTVFNGNDSGLYGGALVAQWMDLSVHNCTFFANTAAGGIGDAVCSSYGGGRVFADSILWDGPDWWGGPYGGGDASVSYSDIEGGWPGVGNIDADPLFVDADGPDGIPGTTDDDLHLQPTSPCVDAGDPAYDPGPGAQDIDGEPRVQQCRVDMGADESPYFADDCNGNGVADGCDIASGYSQDCDSNHVPDECDPFVDCNGNGVFDACDVYFGFSTDCNGNSVPDECDIAGGQAADCNGNGLPDECDLAGGSSADCNSNGVPDECDIAMGFSQDCQPNGIPDECEADCNYNGSPDSCDIANGTSLDADGNGVPDECEGLCIGDLNCDGIVDFADINPFVLYLSHFGAWQATYSGCSPLNGDINGDGTYGQASFGDINPFVTLLTQCGMGCACPGPGARP
jgi:predicted outer membrane repeat protein